MDKLPMMGMWGVVLIALVVSGVAPYERVTWWMEVAPIFIVAPVLWLSHKRFPLTPMLMALIALHALVLIVGGGVHVCACAAWLLDAGCAAFGS